MDVEWYNETRSLSVYGAYGVDDHERTRAVLHCRERQLKEALARAERAEAAIATIDMNANDNYAASEQRLHDAKPTQVVERA